MSMLTDYHFILGTVAPFLGWFAFGVLAVIGLFNKSRRVQRLEDDQTASNLITNLRTTVDVQEKTINQMQVDAAKKDKESREETHALRDQLNQLVGRNTILEELFKGRDPKQDEFFKQAPDVFKIMRETHTLVQQQTNATVHLTEAITKLIDRMDSPKIV